MSNRVLTFGELMIRLAPPGYQRFFQSPAFEATFGGGEANVAVSLATFGIPAGFVSRFPANPLGDAAVGELKRHNVDTSGILRGGERMGIYYCEKGASQRASKVVYDRAHSAISTAKPGDFDWARLFEGVEWFHFTGITPALSDSCAELCKEACMAARKLGVKVSCDLNYRKNLWSTQKAGQVMEGLMGLVDVLIANEEDAEKVFGIKAGNTDVGSGQISHQGYLDVASQIHKRFGIKDVAITLRESHSANDNGWAGMLWRSGVAVFSKSYEIHIVDRVGGGDSFAAGLIYALLSQGGKTVTQPAMNDQEAIEFAVAASCLKHSIEGDFNLASLDEVKALTKGDGSGRVQR